jgi:hypothetical protein
MIAEHEPARDQMLKLAEEQDHDPSAPFTH